jgi:hypothetical protein
MLQVLIEGDKGLSCGYLKIWRTTKLVAAYRLYRKKLMNCLPTWHGCPGLKVGYKKMLLPEILHYMNYQYDPELQD